MAWETEILTSNIVLLGHFNPAIFSAAWFERYAILTEQEAKAAEQIVLHQQVSQVTVDHLTIIVEPKKCVIKHDSDPVIRCLDIAQQIFGDLLPHTPVYAFGVNYAEHWSTETPEQRMQLGRALAPLEPWGAWGRSLPNDDPSLAGGMTGLVMKKPLPPLDAGGQQASGHFRVEIGPSGELTDQLRGVVIGMNYHREFPDKTEEGAERTLNLLGAEFDAAIIEAKNIISDMKLFAKGLHQ